MKNLYTAFASIDNTAMRQTIEIPKIKGEQPTYAYVMPIIAILHEFGITRAKNEKNNSKPNRYMLNILHNKTKKVYNNNTSIAGNMRINSITIIADAEKLMNIQDKCRTIL